MNAWADFLLDVCKWFALVSLATCLLVVAAAANRARLNKPTDELPFNVIDLNTRRIAANQTRRVNWHTLTDGDAS